MEYNIQRGYDYLTSGDFDTARKLFTMAIIQYPDNYEAWEGMYQVSLSEREKILCLKQMISIKPDDLKSQQELAILENTPLPGGVSAPAVVSAFIPEPDPAEAMKAPQQLRELFAESQPETPDYDLQYAKQFNNPGATAESPAKARPNAMVIAIITLALAVTILTLLVMIGQSGRGPLAELAVSSPTASPTAAPTNTKPAPATATTASTAASTATRTTTPIPTATKTALATATLTVTPGNLATQTATLPPLSDIVGYTKLVLLNKGFSLNPMPCSTTENCTAYTSEFVNMIISIKDSGVISFQVDDESQIFTRFAKIAGPTPVFKKEVLVYEDVFKSIYSVYSPNLHQVIASVISGATKNGSYGLIDPNGFRVEGVSAPNGKILLTITPPIQ